MSHVESWLGWICNWRQSLVAGVGERDRFHREPVRTEGWIQVAVLSDQQIVDDIRIEPLHQEQCAEGVVSFGVSSYGYDVRVGTRFKIFTNTTSGGVAVVDPKQFTDDLFLTVDTDDTDVDYVIIPPNSFALAETVEWIEVPRDVLAICVGKSTYARCGLVVNVTPLEPEWRGKVTLEISNTTPLPAKVYANEGIAQMIFLRADSVCNTSYADRRGKYQDQEGLTLPCVLTPAKTPPQ